MAYRALKLSEPQRCLLLVLIIIFTEKSIQSFEHDFQRWFFHFKVHGDFEHSTKAAMLNADVDYGD